MSTFTLAVSGLTTSNLPWFMALTFQVHIQYCFLQHRTSLPSLVTSTTGFASLLAQIFFPSEAISVLFFSSISGPYSAEEFIFQCHIFLPFHTIHGVLKARIQKCFPIPFSSRWTIFRQNSPQWLVHLGWPYMALLIVPVSETRPGPCDQIH